MIWLYPLRPTPLLLISATSFMIWLFFADLIFLLLFLNVIPMTILVLAYFKYLFVVLERTLHGHGEPPVLAYEFMKPFEESRPYQLALTIAGVATLSVWLWKLEWHYPALLLVLLFLGALPAYIGLLGMRSGFLHSLNPVTLMRFMARIGMAYWAMWAVLAVGIGSIVLLYRTGPGLYPAIWVSVYSLILVFHWIGKVIYRKRQELDYRPDISPERAAEEAAAAQLQIRKQNLQRIFKERRRENTLAVLLAIIEEEADKLGAHAWYHAEMMRWDLKRLAVQHGLFYAKALRASGKPALADLIVNECRAADPDAAIQ